MLLQEGKCKRSETKRPCQPRLFIASVGDNFYWSGVTPGQVCRRLWTADKSLLLLRFTCACSALEGSCGWKLACSFQALGKRPGHPSMVPTTRAAPCTRCPRKIDLRMSLWHNFPERTGAVALCSRESRPGKRRSICSLC